MAIAIDNLGCVQVVGPLVPGEVFPATPGLSTIVIKAMDFAKGQSYHGKGPSKTGIPCLVFNDFSQ